MPPLRLRLGCPWDCLECEIPNPLPQQAGLGLALVELAVAPAKGAAAVGLAEWVALVGLAMK